MGTPALPESLSTARASLDPVPRLLPGLGEGGGWSPHSPETATQTRVNQERLGSRNLPGSVLLKTQLREHGQRCPGQSTRSTDAPMRSLPAFQPQRPWACCETQEAACTSIQAHTSTQARMPSHFGAGTNTHTHHLTIFSNLSKPPGISEVQEQREPGPKSPRQQQAESQTSH